jgi:hypothetical protein
MRRTRQKGLITEGAYDFYDDQEGGNTLDKIINYYLDKIRKYGQDSLTNKEKEIFEDAKKGKLLLDRPIYKKDKVTGDIQMGPDGRPIRLDKDNLIPGVPFITSKGKGGKKANIINGRCYWNIDDSCRYYYVYDKKSIDEENPNGLIIWKSVSKSGKEYGAFIVPKTEANLEPDNLWKNLNKKFDKGVVLDKETYAKFLEFDNLYHTAKKANIEKIDDIVDALRKYPIK